MCKDPGKEVVVVSAKVETDSSVGMSMIGRFWDVKENLVINNYFGKRVVSTNASYLYRLILHIFYIIIYDNSEIATCVSTNDKNNT